MENLFWGEVEFRFNVEWDCDSDLDRGVVSSCSDPGIVDIEIAESWGDGAGGAMILGNLVVDNDASRVGEQ